MMKGKTNGLRRLLSTLLSVVLLLSSVTIPAAAESVDDALKGYAQTLSDNNKYKGAGSAVTSGTGKDNYALGETSAGTGRRLYVIEVKTTKGYVSAEGLSESSSNRLDCAVFYVGTDMKVHWTDDFNFTKNAAQFMGKNAAATGGTDVLSITLPGTCLRILGIYFHKAGTSSAKAAWSAELVRVAQINGKIGDLKTDNGVKSRSYTGAYVAGTTNLTALDKDEWGGYCWALTAMNGAVTGSGSSSSGVAAASSEEGAYILELVTGSDGYAILTGSGGTVSISYKDTTGKSATKTVELASALKELYPDADLKNAASADNWKSIPTGKDWLKLSDKEMTGLASGYTGNSFIYAANSYTEACLEPYSATSFKLTLPKNIDAVTSVTVTLANNDSLSVQSIRLFDVFYISPNYLNGSLSVERTCDWQGYLVAETNSSTRTINGKSSWTWTQGTSTTTGLTSYAYGARKSVINSSTGVGVSVQLADIYGAGMEELLAGNLTSYSLDKDIKFDLKDTMKSAIGEDAVKALHNLNPLWREPFALEVTYKDTYDCTRKVSVPFLTTYLLCALQQSGGKLNGGSWATWISGIFQQNENAALILRLAEYKSMVGIKLSYGTRPNGFNSANALRDVAVDSIAVENICIYENVTTGTFKTTYDKDKLALTLTTSLTPTYSWSAESEQGKQLSGGGAISAALADSTLKSGEPRARSFTTKYLFSIKTADIENADTGDDIEVSISYTDTNGAARSTPAYSLRTLVNAFYGAGVTDTMPSANSEQYYRHMRRGSTAEFVLDLAGVDSIDSITFKINGSSAVQYDNWQMESVTVYRLSSLGQRAGVRTSENSVYSYITWTRSHNSAEADRVASARQSVLLYKNNPTRTVSFTGYSETGEEIKPSLPTREETYITTIPTHMTYEDTLKDLGLAAVKCNYRIDVEVADLEDAGSMNYFYFQLVFENGESGVVLANQQLASDSFRQGCTESFRIKTTQNYGDIKAVRIICDAAASTSNVFDKLNISKISVTLTGSSGVSKTWMVENVGWIDITYVDEGENQGMDGMGGIAERSISNADITKEFAITRMATAVDLLFCISTASGSTAKCPTANSDLDTSVFEATLVYLDGNGVEQSRNFDLKTAIAEYNDTENLRWHFRAGHDDRFRLTMTDVSSITSLIISRGGDKSNGTWIISSVSVQQIGGLGEVYISTDAEYYRDPVNPTALTTSTNAAGNTYTVSENGNVTIPFNENRIDVVKSSDDDSVWSAAISRVPSSSTDRLNFVVYSADGRGFNGKSGQTLATMTYRNLYTDSYQQKAFHFAGRGTVNGEDVLYGKGMKVEDTISTLHTMTLSCDDMDIANNTPATISKVVVQHVRGNVILDTYQVNYGSHDLQSATASARLTALTDSPMYQTLTMQLAEGQSRVLTAESDDVAVALRYTSSYDPENTKTVYQTPYVFLTDAGYTALREGELVKIPFDATFVDSIVGISIVSSGAPVKFDNAIIENFSGTRDTTTAVLLSTASIAEEFTVSTIASELDAGGEDVVPVTFTFTTSAEETAVGAGTSGKVTLRINYQDGSGKSRSVEFTNLLRRLSGTPSAGGSVTMRVLLSDLDKLENAVVTAEDSWHLASVTAQLEASGDTETFSTSVNNWARSGSPLTIDLGEYERHNYVQSFSVTGAISERSGIYSAASGGTLAIGVCSGDTITLTPAVTAVGSPDTTWTWNPSGWDDELTVHADGTATFRVPTSWHSPDSATFSVTSNADNRKTVTVTIMVVYDLAEEEAETPVVGPDGEELIEAAVAGEGEGEPGPLAAE